MVAKKTSGKNTAKPSKKKADLPVVARPSAPAVRGNNADVVAHETNIPVVREESPPPVVPPDKTVARVTVKTVARPSVKTVAKTAAVVNAVKTEDAGAKRGFSPRPMPDGNPYAPTPATVAEVIRETENIKTLRVVLEGSAMRSFAYEPGQVGQLSVFGMGESTFVINSPPSQKEYLQFSVMRAGEVTSAIHRLSAGDKVGVRAPLGNFFPYADWKGKDIFFVGGGIGMAPLRTIMLHLLERRKDYGKISLLYGARSPLDMAFAYELEDWMRRPDLDCTLTIDAPFEGWRHKVGLIPNVLLELAPAPKNCLAVICGPPIMIKFTVQALEKLQFAPENIITTLEKRMKCGIGICGRCNIGGRYVCMDGPVFSWAELQKLPPEL
jgi:NAD(P)H-flavin reductase